MRNGVFRFPTGPTINDLISFVVSTAPSFTENCEYYDCQNQFYNTKKNDVIAAQVYFGFYTIWEFFSWFI